MAVEAAQEEELALCICGELDAIERPTTSGIQPREREDSIMKLKTLCLSLCFAGAALFGAHDSRTFAPSAAVQNPRKTLNAAIGGTPLYFVANGGQHGPRVLFQARTPGYALWLLKDGLVFDRVENNGRGESIRTLSRMTFKGANESLEVAASDPSDYRVSYFNGRYESDWKTGISTSRAVFYKNIYDGIDLKVYGTEQQIEYDWIVAPGAKPDDIRFAFSGADEPKVDGEGNLLIETTAGRIIQRRPSAYQVIGGRRAEVEASFLARKDGSFGLRVGAYDQRFELTIDPLVLVCSSYLGGLDSEQGGKIATDRTGAMYVAGITYSGDFPPGTGSQFRRDFFVTKLSPDGKSLIYAAFFPGADKGYLGLTVDAKGFVYLTGTTNSNGFPLKNAFRANTGGRNEGFVLKLSRDGKSLVFSSYIGGSDVDYPVAVAVDATGAAYVGGFTLSRDFPTVKAFQPVLAGHTDAFIAKVDPRGGSLIYSTFLGGSNWEGPRDLAVDADGAAVLVGITGSYTFPLKSAFQNYYGGGYQDGFIVKLAAGGKSLVFSSYFGGNSFDDLQAVALDGSSAIYVAGDASGSFPVKNAFQKTKKGAHDAVVAKIDAKGQSIVYSSFLGGTGEESSRGIAVDASGAAHVIGFTGSADFPVKTPYQATRRGALDAFLTIVDPSGSKLVLSTFLGGSYRDTGAGVALGAGGEVYLSGVTNSPDFPGAANGYQATLAGDYDIFVVKFMRDGAGRVR